MHVWLSVQFTHLNISAMFCDYRQGGNTCYNVAKMFFS